MEEFNQHKKETAIFLSLTKAKDNNKNNWGVFNCYMFNL